MTAYYNENDPFAAAWLRELIRADLIASGEVDERPMQRVKPADLVGFAQVHLFAGIGGWSYALRLAGWPDDRPVWTGSCPCQPFSSAGAGGGTDDEPHLWPFMFDLIRRLRPPVIFGEQVASAAVVGKVGKGSGLPSKVPPEATREGPAPGCLECAVAANRRTVDENHRPEWFAGVCADLEDSHYAVGACDLPAAGVAAPHIRQRLFWVADAGHLLPRPGQGRRLEASERREQGVDAEQSGMAGGLAYTSSSRRAKPRTVGDEGGRTGACRRGGMGDARCERAQGDVGRQGASEEPELASAGIARGVGHSECQGQRGERTTIGRATEACGTGGPDFWSAFDVIHCRDGKARRVEPGTHPLASGISGRVGKLRGYGNSIVPQVAAEFIGAYQDLAVNPERTLS